MYGLDAAPSISRPLTPIAGNTKYSKQYYTTWQQSSCPVWAVLPSLNTHRQRRRYYTEEGKITQSKRERQSLDVSFFSMSSTQKSSVMALLHLSTSRSSGRNKDAVMQVMLQLKRLDKTATLRRVETVVKTKQYRLPAWSLSTLPSMHCSRGTISHLSYTSHEERARRTK